MRQGQWRQERPAAVCGDPAEIKGREALTGQPCGERAMATQRKPTRLRDQRGKEEAGQEAGLGRWGPMATLSTRDLTRWGMGSHSRLKTLRGSCSNYRL